MITKQCRQCSEVKPLDAFSPAPDSRDGYRHICRQCRCDATLAWNVRKRNRHISRLIAWPRITA